MSDFEFEEAWEGLVFVGNKLAKQNKEIEL